jgi:hypothetical protein
MSFHAMNAALCRHLQLPVPAAGPLLIRFDDSFDVIVDTAADGERVTLNCRLCEPFALSDAQALRMLQAHDLARGTDGARLCLDPTGQAWLTQRLDAQGLMLDAYIDRVTRFVNTAAAWHQVLADGDAIQAPTSAMAPGAMPIYG